LVAGENDEMPYQTFYSTISNERTIVMTNEQTQLRDILAIECKQPVKKDNALLGDQ